MYLPNRRHELPKGEVHTYLSMALQTLYKGKPAKPVNPSSLPVPSLPHLAIYASAKFYRPTFPDIWGIWHDITGGQLHQVT